MRVLSVAFFAVASLAQAHAEDQVKKPWSDCNYVIGMGDAHTVPAGEALCWRVPPPSYKEYTLLQCDGPSFQELRRVKPGDPHCNIFEERQ